MKILLSLYFFMIAIVQAGLFLGIFHYYRSQNLVKASQYWLSSLFVSSAALVVFGVGILGVDDVSRPDFIFTVANLLFFLASLLQTIFCISLNKPISKNYIYISLVSCIAFIAFFEFLRLTSTFEARSIFMVAIASTCYVIQILQIRKTRNQDKSKQLVYLQTVTALELTFAIARLTVLLMTGVGVKSVEQLPQFLILFTLAQLVMNTLSYIAIAGYKSEEISYAKAKSDAAREAAEVKITEMAELLKEKERLIYGLMKANKTAATGALSASIAHELNQPLGASNLNIQFLKMKLERGALNPEVGKDILDSLEEDNKRAATIVKSLRSIFTEGESNTQRVNLGDLISKVLSIVKPELKSKNIQIQLHADDELLVLVNSSEIEQVILNLLNNAIQALGNSSTLQRRITIEATKADQSVRLSISDNGMGVPFEFKSQLFELLSTTKQTGMGLGLWLCKHIVTRYNGTISYEDTIGGGAKFMIELPLAD
jgi:C4-dicarboxylate-specific signal transduction histidine kinase